MRKTALLILFVALSLEAMAQVDVQVTWDPNSEPDLAGYHVWWGVEPEVYPNVQDAGYATSDIINSLYDGSYYIAVTAYDLADNESGFSQWARIIINITPPYEFPPSPTDWFPWLWQGAVWDASQHGELLTNWIAIPGWTLVQSSEFAFRMANWDARIFKLVMVFQAQGDGRVRIYMRDSEILPHGDFHFEDVLDPVGHWSGSTDHIWVLKLGDKGIVAKVESDRHHITFWWIQNGMATQIPGINLNPTGGAVDILDIWSVVYQN